MFLIYKHACKQTGKCYIGYTKFSIEKRWQEHVFNSLNSNIDYHFYYAIRKYGKDDNLWEHDVIEDNISTLKEACEAEQYWINYYNSFKNGYNMTKGGDGFKSFHTLNSKLLIKEKTKLAMSRPEVKEKMSVGIKNKLQDQKFIEKRNRLHKIAMRRLDVRLNISLASQSRPQISEETSNKMSISQKIAQNIPEVKERKNNSIRKAYENPQVIQKCCDAQQRLMKDQKYRERRRNSQKIAQANPAVKSKRYKKVAKFDLNENLIEVFESITQASKITKINLSNISQCCRGNSQHKTAGGFIWKHIQDFINFV